MRSLKIMLKGSRKKRAKYLVRAPSRVRDKVEARNGIVKQPAPFKTAEELVARAGEASDAFHAYLTPIIEDAGGEYLKGPRKLPHRIKDKARDDYNGEVGRVIDVERATASSRTSRASETRSPRSSTSRIKGTTFWSTASRIASTSRLRTPGTAT